MPDCAGCEYRSQEYHAGSAFCPFQKCLKTEMDEIIENAEDITCQHDSYSSAKS